MNENAVSEKVDNFPAMLAKFQGELGRALPQHLKADRMARIALTAFRRTPKLRQCKPASVFAAVIQAAQLGLEPDTLGRAYLIPYGDECQFVPGWRGLVDLVNRSGQATVYTGVIFKDQTYTFMDGAKRDLIVHNESSLDAPEDITHAYAIGWVKGAAMPVIELWRIDKIVKHRDQYNKVGRRHYSYENWEMYARKVPLLQVLKYMPSSAELATAISLNNEVDAGKRQGLNLNDALEGVYVPIQEDEAPKAAPGGVSRRSGVAGVKERLRKTTAMDDEPLPSINDGFAADEIALARSNFAAAIELSDWDRAADAIKTLPADEQEGANEMLKEAMTQ